MIIGKNIYNIVGDYATVELTNGMVAKVDIDQIDRLKGVRWWCSGGRKKYARNDLIGYMHRFLLPCGDLEVDHINGDGFDNRMCNLRAVTRRQNMYNIHKDGFRGTNYHLGKWDAYIHHEYKKYHLGRFDTEKEAALAYNKKAVELFGEYANLNAV